MQLLQYANDDTLRALQRRLQTALQSASAPPHRTRPLARTQSVPGRILFAEDSAGGHGSNHSSGSGAGRLQRTSSGSGLPDGATPGAAGGGGGLRRTSSLGVPLAPARERPGGSCPRPGPPSLHRLSGSALRRTSSTGATDMFTPARLAGAAGTPPAAESAGSSRSSSAAGGAGAGGSSSGTYHTPKGPLLPFSPSYEDTAVALGAPHGGKVAARLPGAAPGSPLSPILDLSAALPSWESSGELSSPPGGSPFSAPNSASASYASPARQPSPGSAVGGGGGGGGGASAQPSPSLSAASSLGLSRQPTFSQPYFAEFEEEEPSPAAATLLAAAGAGSAGQRTPPGAAPAPAPSSASARAAGLAAAADHMTAEELHQVCGC